MRFSLIDRIVALKAGEEITAVKSLSLAEDYLAEHFPLFPVLPGVFMLEAMTQAGAWLVRYSEDFAHSVVVLKEARNVKYADFVEPGNILTLQARLLKQDQRTATLKAEGLVDGKSNVSARLVLERYNLAETNADDAEMDLRSIRDQRELFRILHRPSATAAADQQAPGGA